ncbi:MAG: aldose 1-epimerase family protein [Candidatus Velthaea sp.]
MPALFGREWSRAELERRTGRLDQVAGIDPHELIDGRGRGARALHVRAGGGLAFWSIADRALDIAGAEYRGAPLCWRSRNGVAAPAFAEHAGDGFLRTFFGGLLTTCGLGNFGPAGSDAWGTFGLHGRINTTPAEDVRTAVRWDGEECALEVHGTMRETAVFGEDLRLERTLRTFVGSRRIDVHDRVTNAGSERRPHMLLYHCNGGFPILNEHATLHVSESGVRPRDAEAARGLTEWNRGGAPQPEFAEQVFVHEPVACRDGRATAVLAPGDDAAGLPALAVRFDPTQLPAMFSWRMLGAGTYVMGIEPANCPTIEGRVAAASAGTLPFLEPGETRRYDLSFEVLPAPDDVAAALAGFPR